MKFLAAILGVLIVAVVLYREFPYPPKVSQAVIDAAKKGDAEYIERFLAGGGRIRLIADENGRTPLMWAAWNGHRNVVVLLLKHGVRVNQRDDRDWLDDYDGRTALGFAVGGEDAMIVQDLVEAGADIEARAGKTQMTPLMIAISRQRPETVRFLIRRGADLNAQDTKGHTALDMAKSAKYPEMVDMLEATAKERRD